MSAMMAFTTVGMHLDGICFGILYALDKKTSEFSLRQHNTVWMIRTGRPYRAGFLSITFSEKVLDKFGTIR